VWEKCDEQGEFHIYILAYIAPFIVLKPGPVRWVEQGPGTGARPS